MKNKEKEEEEKINWSRNKITLEMSKGMNGDQGTTRNNAFPNVPKKNYHSQGIIISSHSLSFPFL